MTALDPISIYVHIPFCQTKCPYCDFNSYETSSTELLIRERAYVQALIKEYNSLIERFELRNRTISSIFFGGGTPSLFSADSIRALLESFEKKSSFSGTIEISLEANPRSIQEDVSNEKLSSFRRAGVNRLSFGAQSFLDHKLKFLGRWHQASDTEKSFNAAREAGFDNINLDLMFGVANESAASWEQELRHLILLSPEHVSAYMLTLEPGTAFGKLSKKGESLTADDDLAGEMYEMTQEILAEGGYFQYEVSNYSKRERKCLHNLVYWKGGEYLGLGAGAHSYIRGNSKYGIRWSNTPAPSLYVKRIMESGNAEQRIDTLDQEKAYLEYISLGLRLVEGVCLNPSLDPFNDFTAALVNLKTSKGIEILLRNGLLCVTEDNMIIPKNKFSISDSIVQEVISLS